MNEKGYINWRFIIIGLAILIICYAIWMVLDAKRVFGEEPEISQVFVPLVNNGYADGPIARYFDRTMNWADFWWPQFCADYLKGVHCYEIEFTPEGEFVYNSPPGYVNKEVWLIIPNYPEGLGVIEAHGTGCLWSGSGFSAVPWWCIEHDGHNNFRAWTTEYAPAPIEVVDVERYLKVKMPRQSPPGPDETKLVLEITTMEIVNERLGLQDE